MFTHLRGYKFKVESRYKFIVPEGKLTRLNVVSYAKGDLTTETTDKVAVRYDIEVGAVPLVPTDQPPSEVVPPTPADTATEQKKEGSN